MDVLKIRAKDDSELEGLFRIGKGFSDDIGMEFRLTNRSVFFDKMTGWYK